MSSHVSKCIHTKARSLFKVSNLSLTTVISALWSGLQEAYTWNIYHSKTVKTRVVKRVA